MQNVDTFIFIYNNDRHEYHIKNKISETVGVHSEYNNVISSKHQFKRT